MSLIPGAHIPAGVHVCVTCDVRWVTETDVCWCCGVSSTEEISTTKSTQTMASPMSARF